MNKEKKSQYDVECIYKDECSDFPHRCDTCKNNENNKRSYYEPVRPYPYWEWPYITWGLLNE